MNTLKPIPHACITAPLLLVGALVSAPAMAAAPATPEGPASADESASLSSEAGASAASSSDARSEQTPWIKRHAPTSMTFELGLFGGVMIPPKSHELYVPNNDSPPNFGHQEFAAVAPDLGLRLGFYPLSFLGLEVEGAVVPTRTADDAPATIFGFRGHVLGQLPYRVTPFILIGYGFLGASGSGLAGGVDLGSTDIDPALHFGGGVKFYVNRWLALRLDVRDSLSAAFMIEGGRAHYPEILLGVSVLLNRKKPKEPRPLIDTDGDGLYDPGQGQSPEDRCPTEAGPRENQGCPWGDRDQDGFLDNVDKCPDQPGIEPDGCPPGDRDADGVLDNVDQCPDVPGPVENQGCPFQDTDGDGIIDPRDQCVQEPETKNGFQDADGCPDELPKELKKYTGVIKGIYFDLDKDTIKPRSFPILDRAVAVLKDFDDTRVEISGHTDSTGSLEHNIDLSRRRAASVKRYLVEHGVDAARIETIGYGPDKPIADNKTNKGRAKNRRIEFRLLTD